MSLFNSVGKKLPPSQRSSLESSLLSLFFLYTHTSFVVACNSASHLSLFSVCVCACACVRGSLYAQYKLSFTHVMVTCAVIDSNHRSPGRETRVALHIMYSLFRKAYSTWVMKVLIYVNCVWVWHSVNVRACVCMCVSLSVPVVPTPLCSLIVSIVSYQ